MTKLRKTVPLSCMLVALVSACSSSPEGVKVTKADLENRGLVWPLTVDEVELGCSGGLRYATVDGRSYPLGGLGRGEGHEPIEPIWATDTKAAETLKKAGVPNSPPARLNIGDLTAEAEKLC